MILSGYMIQLGSDPHGFRDYDAQGKLVGIDIDNAGHKIQLQDFYLKGLNPNIMTVAA